MKNRIIVGTANDRPPYLKTTLESWSQVDGIDQWQMCWFCEPGCQAVVELIKGIDFCPSTFQVNEKVLGPLRNPFRALDWGLDDARFAVLIEDDSIVAPDVLSYFEFCRTKYQTDLNVLAVCSFTHEQLSDDWHKTHLGNWFSPTVWGTWRGRWRQWLRPTWDHDYSTGEGHGAGWDWNIRLRVMPESMKLCVFPSVSRSQHIGEYGGAHCTPDQFKELQTQVFAGDHPIPEGRWA